MGFLLVLINCATAQTRETRVSLIFCDKTISIKSSKVIEEKNKEFVLDILNQGVGKKGDKVIVSYIYSQTANPSNRQVFEYEFSDMPSYDNLSSLKRKKAILKYQLAKRQYNSEFSQRVLKYCFEGKTDQTTTNLLGSLKVMADIAKEHPSGDMEVFFLSDLCESHFKKYYCHGGKRFKSYKEAETQAKKDLHTVLEYYQLEIDDFQRIQGVSVLLPAQRMEKNEALEMMPIYFKSLCKEIGIDEVIIK